jgi:FMN reductase
MFAFDFLSSPRVLGIAGSPSDPSRSSALLRLALEELSSLGLGTQTIDLHRLPAEALLSARTRDPAIAEALGAVCSASIVVVATPIYKAAYSGLLKTFLDLLPQDALDGKIVLPLATGGSMGHLLAVDYALRPVLGALGCRHVLNAVYATDAQFLPDALHRYRPDGDTQARMCRALAPLTKALARLSAPV